MIWPHKRSSDITFVVEVVDIKSRKTYAITHTEPEKVPSKLLSIYDTFERFESESEYYVTWSKVLSNCGPMIMLLL